MSPQRGLQTGGSKVELTGRGFAVDGPPVVYVGRRAAKGVVVHGDQRLTFVTPQTTEPRVVDVVLRFRDGRERVFPRAFEYLEAKGAVLQPSLSK